MLRDVSDAEGDPVALVRLLVKAMTDWGQGMTKSYREQIVASASSTGITLGRKKQIAKLVAVLERLYEAPTTATWLECLRRILNEEHGIPGWKALRSDQLYTLAKLRPAPGDDPQALLLAAAYVRASTLRSPKSGFMTVHRAKGLQFDEVALPHCARLALPGRSRIAPSPVCRHLPRSKAAPFPYSQQRPDPASQGLTTTSALRRDLQARTRSAVTMRDSD